MMWRAAFVFLEQSFVLLMVLIAVLAAFANDWPKAATFIGFAVFLRLGRMERES